MSVYLLQTDLIVLLKAGLWPFCRVAGLLMAAPVIGTRSVPIRVRLILALLITVVVAPLVPVPAIDPLSARGVATSFQQVMIGVAMGLSVRVVFLALEVAGQLIGQLMGLMLASMVDPQNGNQVPVIGQFYLLLATLLFLGMDGHLVMIAALVESFTRLPVGMDGIDREALWTFLQWIGVVLRTAVLIALPAVASLLIVNLAFGVMTRSAPQLNIFAVGFPIMIVLGIFILLFTLSGLMPHLQTLFQNSFAMMLVLLER